MSGPELLLAVDGGGTRTQALVADMEGKDRYRPPLALAGEVLRGALRSTLKAETGDAVGPVQFVADPSVGAVVLARRLLPGAAGRT